MIDSLLEILLKSKTKKLDKLFIQEPNIELNLTGDEYEFIAWGDPIMKNGFKEELIKNLKPEFIVNNMYGHYYYILLNKNNGEFFIGNSMFSILPLYYYQNNDKIFFSENALRMGEYLKNGRISNRYILETILFNYPLFNQSLLEDIKLLPSNSYLKIAGTEVTIIKHTKIEDYFSSSPRPWSQSLNDMRDIFLETIKKYLPDKPYAHALTGGFDGRTLVSAGLYYEKNFSCYSFGTNDSKDTIIASQLAAEAGIPFINVELSDQYASESSLVNGKEFIENASGSATFARAHYLYSAKRLSSDYQHILTGNFGSEIFRAAHNAGAVISKNLFTLFNSDSPDDAIKLIEEGNEFISLKKEIFRADWESLKDDILRLPCYNQGYSGLTQNQKFYVFVFEEIFRKYFGAEMVNQFRYIKNRTPFIDIEFLKAIFKTGLAGIHSEFFEHNPFKRYKGQVLYAHIIRKAYPPFGRMMTDKGYKPDDLLSFFGKLNIAKGYVKKVMRKPTPDFDPYAVSRAWEANRKFWEGIPVSFEYFNKGILPNLNKETLFKVISLSYLLETSEMPQRHKVTKFHQGIT